MSSAALSSSTSSEVRRSKGGLVPSKPLGIVAKTSGHPLFGPEPVVVPAQDLVIGLGARRCAGPERLADEVVLVRHVPGRESLGAHEPLPWRASTVFAFGRA